MVPRPARHRWANAIAVAGVLLGHWLTYAIVTPDVHRRAAQLAATGHAYLNVADTVGMALALMACAAIFLRRLTAPDDGALTPIGDVAARLAIFQVAAFTGMEILERLWSGAPVAGVLRGGLLPLGIAIQFALAAVAALAIRWLLRAADRTSDVLAGISLLAPPRTAGLALPSMRIPERGSLRAIVIRGPPILISDG